MSDMNVSIKLTAAVDQFKAAMASASADFNRAMDQMRGSAGAAGGEAGASISNIGKHASEASTGVSGLGFNIDSLVAKLAALAASVGVVAMLKSLVDAGINYNATLETAKMGITSLIAAQSDLTDSSGNLLTGTDALNAANGLAEGQLQKLKIAGLQTSATFQQLAEAYQVAVGAGLGAGLNLDQIRDLTVQITQAAGALGVPMFQINQEVQSILAGTIDMNSRVAKSLGISNEMVSTWKAQNTLADELNKRLAVFSEMGARIADTWVAAKSNLAEVRDTIMGIATAGMFDAMKKSINDAISGLLDLTKGTIKSDLDALVGNMSTAFTAMGKEIGSWITGFVDGLKDASVWLQKNQTYVNETSGSFKILWDQVKGIVGDLIGAAGAVGELDANTSTFAKLMQVAAVAVGYVRDGVTALGILFDLLAGATARWIANTLHGLGTMAGLFSADLGNSIKAMAESFEVSAQTNFNKAAVAAENFKSRGDEAGKSIESLNASLEKTGTASDGFKTMQADIDAFNVKVKSGEYTQQQLLAISTELHLKWKEMGKDGSASMAEVEQAAKSLDTGVTAVQKSSTALDAALKALKVDTGHLSGGVSTFAIESVNEFAKVASAAGATGSTISAAFNNALGQTKFKADVDALVADLNKANAAGKLTSQEFALAMAGATAKIQEFSGGVKTAFSKAYSDAAISLHGIENDAAATAGQVRLAFDKLIDAAKTKQEAEALKAEFGLLKESGKLSAVEIKDEYARLQDKLRETAGQIDGPVGDSFKRLGIKTAEEMKAAFDQLVIDFNRIKDSGKASAEGIDAAYQKIKSSVVASVQAMTTASREALQAAKDHTTAMQAGADAIKAQGTALVASANAQKADAEYAKASEEAMKSGSAAAMAKADALGVAAQAAHAAADAAMADAAASQAAAVAAKAEEAAKKAIAAAAANPSEWTKQAAAAAQNFANETARGAEEAKQAAINAQAIASEMSAVASAASAMASSVSDAGDSMGKNWVGNMAKDGTTVATMTGAYFVQLVKQSYDAAKTSIQEVKSETDKLIERSGDAIRTFIAFGEEGTAAYYAALQQAKLLGEQLAKVEEATRRNEEATKAWASAMDSLRGIAASLKDELDRALGNDKSIEDRAYIDKKKALQAQYDAAMAAAKDRQSRSTSKAEDDIAAKMFNDAQQAYQDAMRDLDTLHAMKLADIASAAKAKSESDQKNHQDELARIAAENSARTQTADLISRVSAPTYSGGTSTSSGGVIAQTVASSGTVNASYGAPTYNQTLNITTTDMSEDSIRRTVVPAINKIMSGSR